MIIEIDKLKDIYTQCNCSICRRLSAKWIYYKLHQVKIRHSKPIKSYEWGDKDISFKHCSVCGCTTHYTSNDKSKLDRIAINANMLDPKLIENLKIRHFNGAEM